MSSHVHTSVKNASLCSGSKTCVYFCCWIIMFVVLVYTIIFDAGFSNPVSDKHWFWRTSWIDEQKSNSRQTNVYVGRRTTFEQLFGVNELNQRCQCCTESFEHWSKLCLCTFCRDLYWANCHGDYWYVNNNTLGIHTGLCRDPYLRGLYIIIMVK